MQNTGTPPLYSEQPAAVAQAAILFSAGHDAGAIEVLEAELQSDAEVEKTKAWGMLLEIHHIRADRAAFESAVDRYAGRLDCSPPAWAAHEHHVSVPGMFRLGGAIGSKEDLAGLIEHARTRKMVGIDMGRVERIRYEFAPEFCALLRTYSNQGKRIILGNILETHAQLLEVVGEIAQVVLLRSRPATQTRFAVLQAA